MSGGVCKILYTDNETFKNIEINVNFVEELENFLIHIPEKEENSRLAFDLIHSNGNTLVLAISPDGCFAYYMDAAEEMPHRSSLGDSSLSKEDGHIEFMYGGHYSLIPKRCIISFGALLQTAKAFFVSGNWPETVIDWE